MANEWIFYLFYCVPQSRKREQTPQTQIHEARDSALKGANRLLAYTVGTVRVFKRAQHIY